MVGTGRLAGDIAGRQQRGICRAKRGTRLSDASGCLREIKVLFQRKRYESSQLRITETRPPCGEVGTGSRVPVIYCGLALEPLQHEHIGPDVIGADSAACRQAGNNECGKDMFGRHGASSIEMQ